MINTLKMGGSFLKRNVILANKEISNDHNLFEQNNSFCNYLIRKSKLNEKLQFYNNSSFHAFILKKFLQFIFKHRNLIIIIIDFFLLFIKLLTHSWSSYFFFLSFFLYFNFFLLLFILLEIILSIWSNCIINEVHLSFY